MTGLVPGTHVVPSRDRFKTWMAGSSPAKSDRQTAGILLTSGFLCPSDDPSGETRGDMGRLARMPFVYYDKQKKRYFVERRAPGDVQPIIGKAKVKHLFP